MIKARTGSSRQLSRLLFLAFVGLLIWRIGVNIRHNVLDRQLIAAVNAKNLTEVKRLLDQGADPLTKDSGKSNEQRTVLQLATNATAPDDHRLFDLLLDHTRQVNPRGDDGAEVLTEAAYRGRNDVVRQFLDHGANIEARDRRGFTLFQCALTGGHIDTVRLLLDRGAAEYYRKHNGSSSLLFMPNKEILRLLLDRGFDANAITSDGMSLLLEIAGRPGDDVVTVRVLLQHGAHVNVRSLVDASAIGRTVEILAPLLQAIRSRNFAIAELLIGSGADVNAADALGVTPLMAAQYGQENFFDPVSSSYKTGDAHAQAERRRKIESLVRNLLAHGAEVNALDRSGQSPLVYALAFSRPEIVRLLLERGASVDALAAAARMVPAAGLRFLLGRGARIDARDPTGSTALINAVNRNALDCAALLLARGIQVDAPNAAGNTALMSAIRRMNDLPTGGNLSAPLKTLRDLIRLLLAHGANVNARNRDGVTALMLTAGVTGVGPDIVQMLLDHGAHPQTVDNRGKNALFYAVGSGHTDTLKLLLGRGLSVNSRDHRGETPLISLLKGTLIINQTIAALLARGADMNARDADGQTALQVALQHRHSKAAEQLRQAGARE